MTHPLARRLAAGAPDWARRPMLAWDHDELSRRRPFVTASEWRAFSTIELPEIVGTAHPDHAGLSRTQLLECGERMPHNLARAAENPGYYTDDGPKLPLMHYVGYAGGPLSSAVTATTAPPSPAAFCLWTTARSTWPGSRSNVIGTMLPPRMPTTSSPPCSPRAG